MNIGLPWWIGAGDPIEGIRYAHEMGVDFLEVSLDPPWPEALDGDKLRKAANEEGIELCLHGPWRTQALAHPQAELAEAARSVMQTCVAFAQTCGAAYIVVHVDARDFSTYPVPEPVREGLNRARASLAAMRSGMGETQLLVENTSSPMGTPEEIERFLSPLPGVGFCYDPGHAALVEQAGIEGSSSDVATWMDRLGDRWELLHVMDWATNEDGIVDHLVPGAGDADVERIVHEAKKQGCQRTLIEAFYRDADRDEANDEDIREAVAALQQWV